MGELQVTNKETRMEKAGASREASYKVLAASLTANDIVLDKFGGEHEVPNHPVRLKAAETIARMNGDIKPDGSVTVTTNNISITAAEFEAIVAKYGAPKILRQSGEIIDVTYD